jgi:hypothetical protein
MARSWESRFAVNHLGHFALASGLHRVLAAVPVRAVARQVARGLAGKRGCRR